MTLEELKAALLKWDKINGSWPEHEYEGLWFWDWLNRGQPDDDRDDPAFTERYEAWLDELGKLRR